jgi:hypothetical protein
MLTGLETSKDSATLFISGIVIVSSNVAIFEVSSWLNYYCINNQAEYEAPLFGLEILQSKACCSLWWLLFSLYR